MSVAPEDRSTHFSLPRDHYFSDQVYQREVNRVFSRQWLMAGHVSMVKKPGDFYVRQLGFESMIIVRDKNGVVRAFFNLCRHRGFRICDAEASGHSRRFTCPYHAWTYDTEGRLLAAPGAKNGIDFDFAQYGLQEAWCQTFAGFIYVYLSKETPPALHTALGRNEKEFEQVHPQRMKLVRRETYIINANWKSVVENDGECYHCGTAHPPLASICEYRGFYSDSGLQPEYPFPLKPGCKTFSIDGDWVCTKPFAATLPAGFSTGFLLFPFFCGPVFFADHCVSLDTAPLSVDKTQMGCDWYVHEDAVEGVDYSVERLIKIFHLTNLEDKALMERNYQGIQSLRYEPGPNVGTREQGVRLAYSRYFDLMGS